MFCLKCGREVPSEQVFCDSCLETMANYPVKPGTAVHLPNRTAVKKASGRKRELSAEEQLLQLKQTVKRLAITVVILVLALGLSVTALIFTLGGGEPVSIIGKNYTIDTNQASTP